MIMNRRYRHLIWLVILVLACFFKLSAQGQHLVIVGGGTRPAEAMSRFVKWAGGKEKARILIIPWATAEPEESFKYLKEDIAPLGPQHIELAPIAPFDAEKRAKFLNQLQNATGVFFTGGDQVRIMEVLKDGALLDALKQKYMNGGAVFGGTSAGTAIMSQKMITGEGDFTVIDAGKVQTIQGLGLLPANVIVDQHFIKRQRQNRLFGLVMENRENLGLGIDEDTAVLLTGNRFGEVVGTGKVMMIDARTKNNSLTIYLVNSGERLDLQKRVPINNKSLKQSK